MTINKSYKKHETKMINPVGFDIQIKPLCPYPSQKVHPGKYSWQEAWDTWSTSGTQVQLNSWLSAPAIPKHHLGAF